MVQAIENWADLSGRVLDLRPRQGVPDMSEMVVHVDRADDVEGYPNLLTEAPGEDLAIAVKTDKLREAGLETGAEIHCRVQRAGPGTVVAHPRGPSGSPQGG
jgi:hypothetical protein